MPNTIIILFLSLLGAVFCAAQNFDLAGIAHVAFRVAHYHEARDFYQRLGFEQAFEFADPGKPRVSYIKVNDHQFIELYESSADSRPGFMHLCFESNDLESLRNRYLKLGLTPTEAKKFRAGNLLFTMHDPSGQLLEYTQYLPGSLHSLDRGKHLGQNRISERLLASAKPASNLEADHNFYASLGFRPLGSRGGLLLALPGEAGQWIELLSGAEARPRITFVVDSPERAKQTLRQHGIKFDQSDGRISIADPEGAMVVFAVPSP